MKICVLGAGVLGVTTAYELAKRGHEITVIDRQPEPSRECSFANGGQLSYSASEPWANPHAFLKVIKWMWQEDAPLVLRFSTDPHMIRWGILFLLNCTESRAKKHDEALLRLGLYSKKKFDELFADTNVECHQLSKGILHVFSDKREFRYYTKAAEKGVCGEKVLNKGECFALEPALSHTTRDIIGGIHVPIDESGDIYLYTTRLARLIAAKYGVKFRYNVPIARIHKKKSTVTHITTDTAEEISGFDVVVMSLGAYSPVYLRQLGLHVPIYPMKGYTITLPANEFTPTVSITDSTRKQVYTKLGDRVRVAGTAEFAGYNHDIRKVRIDPLIRGTQQLFPRADFSKVEEWACLRPSTPDGPPIIGKTPIENLYMNTGHGTLGWTQAAGSARLLADIIDNKPTEISMDGFGIERNLIRF